MSRSENRKSVVPLGGVAPVVDERAWVSPTSTLVGDVRLAEDASVWFGAVLRGDGESIEVGAASNVQDGCVVHADPGFGVRIGAGVTIGHRAVVHGCTIEDGVLVGMGAVVLNGASIGRESLIAAGTVVLEGVQVPPHSLVAGVPGKVRRQLTDPERQSLRRSAETYVELARRYVREGY